jgi:hypothetical protein
MQDHPATSSGEKTGHNTQTGIVALDAHSSRARVDGDTAGLAGQHSGTACSPCDCVDNFLRRVARHLRIERRREAKRVSSAEIASGRHSDGPVEQLERIIASPDSALLSNSPGVLGASRGIWRDESATGKENLRTQQGRIDTAPMPFLHLGVHFEDNQAPDRKAIEEVLNKAKDWYRYAPNCWLIFTSLDADEWSRRLKKIPGMEDHTSFLVCEVLVGKQDKRAGWMRQTTWDWIKKDRSSS